MGGFNRFGRKRKIKLEKRVTIATLEAISGGYRPWDTVKWGGFWRGRRDEQNGTGFKTGGGRRRKKSAREGDGVLKQLKGLGIKRVTQHLFIVVFPEIVTSLTRTIILSNELRFLRTLCLRREKNRTVNRAKLTKDKTTNFSFILKCEQIDFFDNHTEAFFLNYVSTQFNRHSTWKNQ